MRHTAYAIVRNSDSHILLLRRGGTSKSYQGYWEFPGSKIDAGESADEALVREIVEETGLTISASDLRPLREVDRLAEDLHYSFFESSLDEAQPEVALSDEHDDIKWAKPTEARKLPMRDAHREILQWSWLRSQVEVFGKERPRYLAFETTLLAILNRLKDRHAPLAIAQARAKSVSSFLGKCLRKADKYDDPAHQLTDLCGGRLVATTVHEADAICRQIRALFAIDEDEDTGKRHEISAFGYLSVHFIVHIPDGAAELLGITIPPEITGLKAEIQVRTLLQHAHSEVTHDRLYKGNFTPPEDCRREAARVAALLETADHEFARFVTRLDAYIGEYVCHLSSEQRARRIADLSLLMDFETTPAKHLPLALDMARVHRAGWDWRGIVNALDPLSTNIETFPEEATLELGHALCHLNPCGTPEFARGLDLLRSVARPDAPLDEFPEEPDRIRRATALGWLGEALTRQTNSLNAARQALAAAVRIAPEDPYHLVAFAELEVAGCESSSPLALVAPFLPRAASVCMDHIRAGIEIVRAWLALSMIRTLESDPTPAVEALCAAARLTVDHEPIADLHRRFLRLAESHCQQLPHLEILASTAHLLTLAIQRRTAPCSQASSLKPGAHLEPARHLLIVSGGTDRETETLKPHWTRLLASALSGFSGTILSGGSTAGVCGALGDAAGALPANQVRLIGYVPENLPSDTAIHPAYSEIVKTHGTASFSLGEPLQMWADILRADIDPSRVHLLCLGGGEISACELALAWALGARTMALSDGSVAARRFAELLADSTNQGNGFLFPDDLATAAALLAGLGWSRDTAWRAAWEPVARQVHATYLAAQAKTATQPNLLPWENLDEGLRDSNRQQAAYSAEILRRCGFTVEPSTSDSSDTAVITLTPEEIERLAEFEHGRWNAERLSAGWQWAAAKDVERKLSPHLVPWRDLPEPIRAWDRSAVAEWPRVLAPAGWSIQRNS